MSGAWIVRAWLGAADTVSGPDLPSYGMTALRTLAALVIVVVLLLVAARVLPGLLKRPAGAERGGEIEVVATKALGPRRAVHIVRVRGVEYLIGSSEHGLHQLAAGPLEPKAPERPFAGAPGAILSSAPAGAPGGQTTSVGGP